MRRASDDPRAIMGLEEIVEALPEHEPVDINEALELLESDYLVELHRYLGGFHVSFLRRAWFHRAAAVVGADPRRDLENILALLRDGGGQASGPELLEKLGGTVARVLFALDEAESRGYVKLFKLAGLGVETISVASITAPGKRALKEAGR